MARTTREMVLSTDVTRTRDFVLQWLGRNGFEILEENSMGQPLERRFKAFRVSLTTHPGSIVAMRARRLGIIVFEIRLEPRDRGCSVHGEFYAAGGGGGVVNFQGRELDVCEKPDLVGRLPRKKGFRLMSKLISELEAGTSD